jgi:UDP-N-acetylmuramoyl-tripeptide--D-alanyl-D-alanine ligase
MEPKQLYKLFRESEGICTDSRKTKEGQLFFALSGQNFNGNEFAQQAVSRGASYAVIDKQEYRKNEQYIVVPDVLKSLQELGQFHRIKLGIPVIAITGSNGKTTTKELISARFCKKNSMSAIPRAI